ncbi:MAG: carbohydrate kinase [Hyphomicrobiales bacterium]|nr:carbohydrate kinase [Hyphomicrobiales bacterium]
MIICCGEALIDMLPRQLPDGTDVCMPVPGGAVFNTAIALGRLGEDTHFFCGLSTDLYGRQLSACLEASHVKTTFCPRTSRPTTLAFVSLEDGNAEYTFYDENTAGRMLEITDLPDLPEQTQAMQFGAISLVPEPCASSFEQLMHRYCDSAVIALDPNIRRSFIQNEPAYRDRIKRMCGLSDIIKVSQDDLDWLEPGKSFETIAQEWLRTGAKIILLTMGENGVRAITPSLDLVVSAVKVNVVDTVGAGDSFNAGILADLRKSGNLHKNTLGSISENSLRSALTFATRVAAYTVGQAGANPPWAHELPTQTQPS